MSSVIAAAAAKAVTVPVGGGNDISKLLKSSGPVVTAVLLQADGTVKQISVDINSLIFILGYSELIFFSLLISNKLFQCLFFP